MKTCLANENEPMEELAYLGTMLANEKKKCVAVETASNEGNRHHHMIESCDKFRAGAGGGGEIVENVIAKK
jgi:hypothetical protein